MKLAVLPLGKNALFSWGLVWFGFGFPKYACKSIYLLGEKNPGAVCWKAIEVLLCVETKLCQGGKRSCYGCYWQGLVRNLFSLFRTWCKQRQTRKRRKLDKSKHPDLLVWFFLSTLWCFLFLASCLFCFHTCQESSFRLSGLLYRSCYWVFTQVRMFWVVRRFLSIRGLRVKALSQALQTGSQKERSSLQPFGRINSEAAQTDRLKSEKSKHSPCLERDPG